MSNREITQQEIKEALACPSYFGYSGENRDMFKTWALGPVIRHRDSGLVNQSNADAIEKALTERAEFNGQWEITGCNHWAVGWVEHLSYRALDDEGNPTPVFRFIAELYDALQEYPLLDESDHSEREYNATIENIEQAGYSFVSDDAPEDWPGKAFSWFWNNNQSAVESCDDQGGYPSDDDMKACLKALGYLAEEYDDDIDDE